MPLARRISRPSAAQLTARSCQTALSDRRGRLSEAKRLRALEDENAKLKRLLAEAMLDNAGLKDLLAKNW